MNQVRILRGIYHNNAVSGIFNVVKPYKTGKKCGFITVENDGSESLSSGGVHCRVKVRRSSDFEYLNERVIMPEHISCFTVKDEPESIVNEQPEVKESDEEAMNRIASRFAILDEMSAACINGDIRALIVSGPPGVGKSFGVEYQLDKASLLDRLAGNRIRFEIVKGAMTPIGLYAQLYKFSDPQNVLVFDDCDSVFQDDLALNILKAALDSGKRRKIFWNSDSALLRREGIPESFDFRGSAIFITNLKFEHLKSKKLQDHLEALQSRCHFLDLTINNDRDKMLRIRQVHRDASKDQLGGLFCDYNFDNNEAEQILDFMWTNKAKLRELSLRMCLKIADLVKISPNNWRSLAESTCMRG